MPNVNAWFRVNFPVGIGRRQVLVINESRSDSYHIFNAPAAPEPKATAAKEKIASTKLIFAGAINKPTAQVKITKDITLGFINCNKDFKYDKKLKETVFFLSILVVTFIQH